MLRNENNNDQFITLNERVRQLIERKNVNEEYKQDVHNLLNDIVSSTLSFQEKFQIISQQSKADGWTFSMVVPRFLDAIDNQAYLNLLKKMNENISPEIFGDMLRLQNHLENTLTATLAKRQTQQIIQKYILFFGNFKNIGISSIFDNIFFENLKNNAAHIDIAAIEAELLINGLLPINRFDSIKKYKEAIFAAICKLPEDEKIKALLNAIATGEPEHLLYTIMKAKRGFNEPNHDRGILKKCVDELDISLLKKCMQHEATEEKLADFKNQRCTVIKFLTIDLDNPAHIRRYINLLRQFLNEGMPPHRIQWLLSYTLGSNIAKYSNEETNKEYFALLKQMLEKNAAPSNILPLLQERDYHSIGYDERDYHSIGYDLANYNKEETLREFLGLLKHLLAYEASPLSILNLFKGDRVLGIKIAAKCDASILLEFLSLLSSLKQSNSYLENKIELLLKMHDQIELDKNCNNDDNIIHNCDIINAIRFNPKITDKMMVIEKMRELKLLPFELQESVYYGCMLTLPNEQKKQLFLQITQEKENPWHAYFSDEIQKKMSEQLIELGAVRSAKKVQHKATEAKLLEQPVIMNTVPQALYPAFVMNPVTNEMTVVPAPEIAVSTPVSTVIINQALEVCPTPLAPQPVMGDLINFEEEPITTTVVETIKYPEQLAGLKVNNEDKHLTADELLKQAPPVPIALKQAPPVPNPSLLFSSAKKGGNGSTQQMAEKKKTTQKMTLA